AVTAEEPATEAPSAPAVAAVSEPPAVEPPAVEAPVVEALTVVTPLPVASPVAVEALTVETPRPVASPPAPPAPVRAPEAASAPATVPAAAAVPAALRATTPLPPPTATAPLPPPEPAELLPMGPESTGEAMEVLAALSARRASPLRRAVKRITLWGVLVALLLGLLAAGQLLRPLPTPVVKLTAATSFTFAGDPLTMPWPAKGQAAAEVLGVGSLGSSGPENTPVPIASVTKVMNAHLILLAHPLKKGEPGPSLTVDKAAAQESGDADQSTAKVTEGQQISEYEALEMLMLPSANNIARLLARWDSGSEEAFVKKMNDQAAAFGMANTTYADAA
ncbi:D-alanyl-D-alanine carboxypeptidase family protein, partial [Kitasatospora nipponensis]|uniref:D-alanyl-D-alanine carboxypeptidase family protein n=1 Tax=Kitasatospora nipponensis TaxID=258049 RepID=UPI003CD053B2